LLRVRCLCAGVGRRLAKLRHSLDDAKLTRNEWHARWQAERLFLVADGEASKRWGNETIRVDPDQQWLELRLPNPLAQLSNTPGRAATYRLACPVSFTHRSDEWKTQVATGAVRYDISYDPAKDRWYLDASWQRNAAPPPALEELRRHPVLGVDLNAGHLACWVLDASGNAKGPPHTIPLQLDGHRRATTTADCGRRWRPSFDLPLSAAAARSSLRTLTLPTLARSAGKPLVAAGAAGPFEE
jgi:hypothetical protein